VSRALTGISSQPIEPFPPEAPPCTTVRGRVTPRARKKLVLVCCLSEAAVWAIPPIRPAYGPAAEAMVAASPLSMVLRYQKVPGTETAQKLGRA